MNVFGAVRIIIANIAFVSLHFSCLCAPGIIENLRSILWILSEFKLINLSINLHGYTSRKKLGFKT